MMDDRGELTDRVAAAVAAVRAVDMHTHLYPPNFEALAAQGADHVLTYHYLVAEAFRVASEPPEAYEAFWRASRREQADWVWERLFLGRSPLSEAALGVVAVAQAFGVDLARQGIEGLRAALPTEPSAAYAEQVLDMAGVAAVVMTNDPLDPVERTYWLDGEAGHPRFLAALRLDTLLNRYAEAAPRLRELGYRVADTVDARTIDEVRRYLEDWTARMQPVYWALSVADTFTYPEPTARGALLAHAVLPALGERRGALALMMGARRQVNPALGPAGDASGRSSLEPVERLCRAFPAVRFLVSVLSRESQHELVVTARKFGNLMPFGCWWFVNTASLVEEITRMRLELLGPTFVFQHSDARVIEHVIYKWQLARRVLVKVLTDHYARLAEAGWAVTDDAMRRDAEALLAGNFAAFVGWSGTP
jgi:hypothetical protein